MGGGGQAKRDPSESMIRSEGSLHPPGGGERVFLQEAAMLHGRVYEQCAEG